MKMQKKLLYSVVLLLGLTLSACGNATATEEEELDSGSTTLQESVYTASYDDVYWNAFDVGFTQSYSEYYGNENDLEYEGKPEQSYLEGWILEGIGYHLSYVINSDLPQNIRQGAIDGFMDGFDLGWSIWENDDPVRTWGPGDRYKGE